MSATTRHGGQGRDLSMTVSCDGDAQVVLAGALTPADLDRVRDVLVRLLRDVDRVLVDITGLSVADNSLLGVLPDAVDRAGGWPAVQLAVVYAGRTMGQALRASRVARRVAVCDEAELALLRCVQRPVEVRAQWWLPASTAAASRCRSAARLRLATWSLLDEDAMRALVVLNELVVNAVLHAGTAVQVGLVLDEDALWVRVRDFSCGPVSRSQRGLGLGLVNALATQWGYEPREDGKTAWARLDRSPAVDL